MHSSCFLTPSATPPPYFPSFFPEEPVSFHCHHASHLTTSQWSPLDHSPATAQRSLLMFILHTRVQTHQRGTPERIWFSFVEWFFLLFCCCCCFFVCFFLWWSLAGTSLFTQKCLRWPCLNLGLFCVPFHSDHHRHFALQPWLSLPYRDDSNSCPPSVWLIESPPYQVRHQTNVDM